MLIAMGLLTLSGCDAIPEDESLAISTSSVTQISLPPMLRTVAGLDPSALQLSVQVNDIVKELEQGEDNIWSGVVDVPRNQQANISVEWGLDYGSFGYLKLACLLYTSPSPRD